MSFAIPALRESRYANPRKPTKLLDTGEGHGESWWAHQGGVVEAIKIATLRIGDLSKPSGNRRLSLT